MDALSEILRVIRLDSAVYFNAEMSAPWSFLSPHSCTLAPSLSQGPAHVIIYHLVVEGRACAQVVGGERVELVPGDIVTFPHGHEHLLESEVGAPRVDVDQSIPELIERGLGLFRLGHGGVTARFICGYLVCEPRLSQAFLGGLPSMIRVNVRDGEGQWLENSLKFSVAQAANREAGAGAMLTKLSEAAFAETLRRYARQLPDGQSGWLSGARDPEVGRALTLLHHKPAHPWSLVELAREVGVSRTVLAERFRHFLGEPPMTYLTRWRLGLGAMALSSGSASVAQIASDVGYESEASFNRAFKREYGLPPARYRRDRAGLRPG